MDRDKHTLTYPWIKLLDTDDTGTAFAAKTPTTTEPTGAGVVDLTDETLGVTTDGSHCPDMVMIQPYGSNANNEDYKMRVWGWNVLSKPGDSTNHLKLWIPMLLVEVSVVLGNISISGLLANGFLADTITIDAGNSDLNAVSSPTGDVPGYLVVDPMGSKKIEFDFDLDAGGNAAAAANALIRGMS